MSWLVLKTAEKLTLPPIEGKIHLKESRVYYPGEIIVGKVVVNHAINFSLHGIIVTFEGYLSLKWTMRNQTSSENKAFGGINHFIHGEPNQTNRMLMQAGTHNFPFSVEIPKYIPMSYKDAYGQIAFSIVASLLCGSAKIKLGNKNIPIKLREGIFNITGMPPHLSISRSENAFFNKNSGLKFKFRIIDFIYCPGDKIHFNFELVNNHKTALLRIEVIQKFVYKIPLEESKKTSRVVTTYEKEINSDVNMDDFVSLNINDPELLYPSHFGSGIPTIEMDYFIKVELKQNNKILRGEIPIYMDVKDINKKSAQLSKSSSLPKNFDRPKKKDSQELPLEYKKSTLPCYATEAPLIETLIV